MKLALFPTWAPLDPKETDKPLSDRLRCYMTEVQLQTILDHQGAPDDSVDLDFMTTKDGRRISKFSLEAMTIGEDVSDCIRKSFHEFNQNYIGEDSVFPEKSGAPRVMTAFKDKPFEFSFWPN